MKCGGCSRGHPDSVWSSPIQLQLDGTFNTLRFLWDVVPPSGIKPGPPALGAQNLSPWITRDIPKQAIPNFSPSASCSPCADNPLGYQLAVCSISFRSLISLPPWEASSHLPHPTSSQQS